MDDLEFRKRAYSNPTDEDPEFHDAARSDPARQRLLEELNSLENQLSDTVNTISVPDGLAERLKQHGTEQGAESATRPQATPGNSFRFRPHMTLAASLVVALALTFITMGRPGQPSAQDMALHDDIVAHLHDEASEYAGDVEASWDRLTEVVAAGGGRIDDDSRLQDMHVKFARDCDLSESRTGTHIVLEGERGPVSVVFVNNTPVSQDLELDDERFAGRIIPMQEGSMAIVGEKDEPLETFEALARSSFQWSI